MLNKTEEINLSLHRSIFHLLLNYCLQICSLHWRRKKKTGKKHWEGGKMEREVGKIRVEECLCRQRDFVD